MLYTIFLFFIFHEISQVFPENYRLALPEKEFYDLKEAKSLFVDYVKRFDKVYDKQEYKKRLEIFKENLNIINKFNAESNLTRYGINQFTDITYEEFLKCHTGMSENFTTDENIIEFKPTGNAPEQLDYRTKGYVTEIKNQKNCGSCFAFSAIGAIEGQYAMKHGQLISLSEQQGLDCEPTGSCGGGVPHKVMQSLAQQGGSMRNQDYPYEDAKGKCRTDQSKIVVKVSGGNQLSIDGEEALKEALATYGPLSVTMHTSQQFKDYKKDILLEHVCTDRLHAIVVVGYGTAHGIPYWIIKNSWSTAWGEQGYGRIKRGAGICSFGKYAATATVA